MSGALDNTNSGDQLVSLMLYDEGLARHYPALVSQIHSSSITTNDHNIPRSSTTTTTEMSEPGSLPVMSSELHSSFQRYSRVPLAESPTTDPQTSYMSSEVFELVAGGGVTFFVHKAILGHHSQPFKEATSGPWCETEEHNIQLSDWDSNTVGRMVQFMYTGDYTYPDPYAPIESEVSDGGAESLSSTPPEPRRSGALTPFPQCVQGTLHEPAIPPMTDAVWLNCVDTAIFDFEETFLAHAQVYALAQYKSIAALKALAHDRLSRTLLKLHPLGPNPHLAANILSLATYVYANTDSLTNSEEPLRRLISQYVAHNFATWQKDPAAVEMMCAGGEFVRDVLGKICRRLGGVGRAPPGTRYISRFRVS